IAIWMILTAYGPYGWYEKINTLLYRTTWVCKQLNEMGIIYYRHPSLNIITIKSPYVSQQLADKYGLVPDAHHAHAQWYKIVVMDHVEVEHLQPFLEELKAYQARKKQIYPLVLKCTVRYIHQHIRHIIDRYAGEVPLSIFLKAYYKK